MARERRSVLSSEEVEALSHAFDRAPTSSVLRLSLRLKSIIKIGSFASAMIFLSYGELTPHDTQMALRDQQAEAEPTWLLLQRFPLAITPNVSWPAPDLTMPALALLAMPNATPPNKPKSFSQIAIIRAGDNPSSSELSRKAASAVNGPTTSSTAPTKTTSVASIAPGTTETSGTPRLPKQTVKTAATNPLTTFVSNFVSGFNPSSPSKTTSGASTKAAQSFTRDAIRSAIESAQSTNSGFNSPSFGSKSFGSQALSGLKKG